VRIGLLAAVGALLLAASGTAASGGYSLKVESRRDGHALSTARLGDIVDLAIAAHGRPYVVCVDRPGGESCYPSKRARVGWQIASGDGVGGLERLSLRVGGHEVASAALRTVRPVTLFRYSGFPLWAPDGRRVAFDTWDGNVNIEIGDVEVGVANATGDPNAHQVTFNTGVTADRWTPRGLEVHGGGGADTSTIGLYTLNQQQSPRDRLFRIRSDGAVVRLGSLAAALGLGDAVWSRDGRRIAFDSPWHGKLQVFVAHADGSGARRLTKLAGGAGSPTWSADGSELAFDSGGGVYVIGADGKHLRRIASGRAPEWAPAGNRIAYERGVSIREVSPTGGGDRLLAHGTAPVWSPDARLIAFVDRGRVAVMNADGSGLRSVTGRGAPVAHIAWSPDGKRLAFDAGTGCEVEAPGFCQVSVVDATGKNLRRLTHA
jgi:TolB protein